MLGDLVGSEKSLLLDGGWVGLQNTIQTCKYIPIDDIETRLLEYRSKYIECSNLTSHCILFHGATGCGKTVLMNKFVEELFQKWNDDIINVDLHGYFRDSNKSSTEKANELIDAVLFYIKKESYYANHQFPDGNNNLILKEIENCLESNNKFLVVQFPPIKVWNELEVYFRFFSTKRTILMFEADSDDIVKNTKRDLPRDIMCCKVDNLKQGDGKLFLKCYYNSDPSVRFSDDDIESMIATQHSCGGMTITQLERLYKEAYDYAKRENINDVQERDILHAMVKIV